MARNEEKANSMLNRWVMMKQEERVGSLRKRPAIASECAKLSEAERWRHQLLREISQKVGEIQNPALGEHRIRDLNDDINRLIREKYHWERRIVDLGGANYSRAPRVLDKEGNEALGPSGYKYFGEARNLAGVKELLAQPEPSADAKKTKRDVTRLINADYYGFRDDEDGVLEKLEAAAEERLREEQIASWRAAMEDKKKLMGEKAMDLDDDGVGQDMREVVEQMEQEFTAHVPIPDKAEVEAALLEQRKKELLSKYLSDELVTELQSAEQQVKVVTGHVVH
eukprot:TRINITY_DN806_c0_g1_i2.p1 TRINITY_DN806_c0_g1~~TRINITY_DN806_c0_g1_i2.p1  ORF type:complete len:294 (-),score=108.99 TRINITY_DN806_c0_g1_i2:19-864(-)